MRAKIIKAPILALIVGMFACVLNPVNASLDQWVLEKIKKDENILRSAAARTNGREIGLLDQSTTYVPFFLESPDMTGTQSHVDARTMSVFFNQQKPTFLAGGYLYKINFENQFPLYGLSSGEWDGILWHCPKLGKEILIDPLKVWSTQDEDDFSYASIISGVPPRLVVYDPNGLIMEKREFDISDPDLLSKIEVIENTYSRLGKPTILMVSLAEYLRNSAPVWRPVEITPSFNLRNQQERSEEIERLNQVEKLTRKEAIRILESRINVVSENQDSQTRINRIVDDQTNSNKNDQRAGNEINANKNEPSFWPYVVGTIFIIVVIIFLKHIFMRDSTS